MKKHLDWNFARIVFGLLLVGSATATGQVSPRTLDADFPSYEPVTGIAGKLSSVGSDTLYEVVTFWAETFHRLYPEVTIKIEGRGSVTAPPALVSGSSQLGPMSRTMTPEEEEAFKTQYGYKPTPVRVAVDTLGVFVHKDNPIQSLSLEQVDAIFSTSRRRGGRQDIKTWGDLGLTGEWANKPISLYGRNSMSGTHGYFEEQVLKGGTFKDEVKEQPGSASVVLGVHTDRYGIGYSGIGYATPGIRAVPLSEKTGEKGIEASQQNAYSGLYPLTRYLFVYINRAPGKPCDPPVREFIRMICSREGQVEVVREGYFPLPARVAKEEVRKVD